MGTYTSLKIADYEVITTKNHVDPIVMTIFRETDKQIFKRRSSSLVEVPWDSQDDDFEDAFRDGIETVCRYVNTAARIKQRLDIMGFSLNNLEADLPNRIATITNYLEDLVKNGYDDLTETIKLLKRSSLKDWLDVAEFILKGTGTFNRARPPLVDYYFNSSYSDDINGFPFVDIRCTIRLFVEVCEQQSLVIQDISHLVSSGYYRFDEKVCQNSIEMLTGDYPTFSKIVILTEGSTDKLILESSLQLLYPHLVDFYSFLNFEISNAQGGVSSLVSTVKAFAGSGIANRVIAIFDNDTAATVAKKGLTKVSLPSNIKIISYPDFELARNYPTIGPSGITNMDINGLAGSIELYLGSDVLTLNGELVPVQWKGYDESVKKYQGEILRKKSLQESFMKKVERCKADNKVLLSTDWDALRLIWQNIFLCFA